VTAPRRGVGVLCLLWGSYGVLSNFLPCPLAGGIYRKRDFAGEDDSPVATKTAS
jgi:hypothetical protein